MEPSRFHDDAAVLAACLQAIEQERQGRWIPQLTHIADEANQQRKQRVVAVVVRVLEGTLEIPESAWLVDLPQRLEQVGTELVLFLPRAKGDRCEWAESCGIESGCDAKGVDSPLRQRGRGDKSTIEEREGLGHALRVRIPPPPSSASATTPARNTRRSRRRRITRSPVATRIQTTGATFGSRQGGPKAREVEARRG